MKRSPDGAGGRIISVRGYIPNRAKWSGALGIPLAPYFSELSCGAERAVRAIANVWKASRHVYGDVLLVSYRLAAA